MVEPVIVLQPPQDRNANQPRTSDSLQEDGGEIARERGQTADRSSGSSTRRRTNEKGIYNYNHNPPLSPAIIVSQHPLLHLPVPAASVVVVVVVASAAAVLPVLIPANSERRGGTFAI